MIREAKAVVALFCASGAHSQIAVKRLGLSLPSFPSSLIAAAAAATVMVTFLSGGGGGGGGGGHPMLM